jgi:hypothetical protein
MDYYQNKYNKYKLKYSNLSNQIGNDGSTEYTGGVSSYAPQMQMQSELNQPILFKQPTLLKSFNLNSNSNSKLKNIPIRISNDTITNIINKLKLDFNKQEIEVIKQRLENFENVVKLKNLKLDMILNLNEKKTVDLFKNCSIDEIEDLLTMNTSIYFNTSYDDDERIKQYIRLNVELNPLILLFLSEDIINEIKDIKQIAEISAKKKNIEYIYNLLIN